MVLNNRDQKIYNEFLEQVESYQDKRLQVYGYIINDFIKKNYNSNDNTLYDLDDFIQEAYALLYSKQEQIEEVDNELNNLYNRMNDNEKTDSKEEVVFKINLNEYIKTIEDSKEVEILKALLTDEDLNEVAKRLRLNNSQIKEIMFRLLDNLRNYLRDNKYIVESNKGKTR